MHLHYADIPRGSNSTNTVQSVCYRLTHEVAWINACYVGEAHIWTSEVFQWQKPTLTCGYTVTLVLWVRVSMWWRTGFLFDYWVLYLYLWPVFFPNKDKVQSQFSYWSRWATDYRQDVQHQSLSVPDHAGSIHLSVWRKIRSEQRNRKTLRSKLSRHCSVCLFYGNV